MVDVPYDSATGRRWQTKLVDTWKITQILLFQESVTISVCCRTSDNMREERERLAALVETRTAALEETRATQEAMGKKMRLREKRIKELEEERLKVDFRIFFSCVCCQWRHQLLYLCYFGSSFQRSS